MTTAQFVLFYFAIFTGFIEATRIRQQPQLAFSIGLPSPHNGRIGNAFEAMQGAECTIGRLRAPPLGLHCAAPTSAHRPQRAPYKGTGPKIASARLSKAEAKRRKAVSKIAPISIASVRLRNS
jgi:hypothetical protein